MISFSEGLYNSLARPRVLRCGLRFRAESSDLLRMRAVRTSSALVGLLALVVLCVLLLHYNKAALLHSRDDWLAEMYFHQDFPHGVRTRVARSWQSSPLVIESDSCYLNEAHIFSQPIMSAVEGFITPSSRGRPVPGGLVGERPELLPEAGEVVLRGLSCDLAGQPENEGSWRYLGPRRHEAARCHD